MSFAVRLVRLVHPGVLDALTLYLRYPLQGVANPQFNNFS